MKKSIILTFVILTAYYINAQNPPVVEKAAPKSNNTLPSNGTLGSNSGVNPVGNPGTIISYSGNSNSINSKVAPNPNVEPGVFLSSSPNGTVTNTTVTSGTNVQRTTTATGNGGTITTTLSTSPIPPPVTKIKKVAPAPNIDPPVANNPILPAAPANKIKPQRRTKSTTNKPENVVVIEKGIPAYSAVLSNFIPEAVVNKIKSKYGTSVYDIKTVRVALSNKIAYLVRLAENGNFRNELFYDEQ